MNKKHQKHARPKLQFRVEIAYKVARKLKARRYTSAGIWFGLGMMGLIGWSVVVPTLLGAAVGIWLDNRYPGKISWTLTLMIVGLIVGCVNAWHWVSKEEKEMRKGQGDRHE